MIMSHRLRSFARIAARELTAADALSVAGGSETEGGCQGAHSYQDTRCYLASIETWITDDSVVVDDDV